MPTLLPLPEHWPILLADTRRYVPVPIQFVLASIAGAFLIAFVIGLWRRERKEEAATTDPETGLLRPDPFLGAAATLLDREDPPSVLVLDADSPEGLRERLGRLRPFLRNRDVVGRMSETRIALVLATSPEGALRVARGASDTGWRAGLAFAPRPRGARSISKLLEEAEENLGGDPPPPPPAEEKPDRRKRRRLRRLRKDPVTGALAVKPFLRELESIMFQHRIENGACVCVAVLGRSFPDTTGPDGDHMERTIREIVRVGRPEDLATRIATDALAVAAALPSDAVDDYLALLKKAAESVDPDPSAIADPGPVRIGFALFPQDAPTPVRLLRRARTAFRHTGEQDNPAVLRYDPAMKDPDEPAYGSEEDESAVGDDRY